MGKLQPSAPGTTFSIASQVASKDLELGSGTTMDERITRTTATTVTMIPMTKPVIRAMGTFMLLLQGRRPQPGPVFVT